MVEKNMITLTERTIMKSRSGVYSDTAENRRKHRVGQKYGAEKQSDDGEKTEKKETDPAKELEAVNKVIAAINEGKLKLPQEEIMVLIEKKNNLELAKRQAEKIHAGVKTNEEKRNAKEIKETNKKINEASKQKKYGNMNVEEAKKKTQIASTLDKLEEQHKANSNDKKKEDAEKKIKEKYERLRKEHAEELSKLGVPIGPDRVRLNQMEKIELEKLNKTYQKPNTYITPENSEGYVRNLNKLLDKKGYFAHATRTGGIEIYKKGDRKSLGNLKASIIATDYISWGPNEDLKDMLEPLIKEALSSTPSILDKLIDISVDFNKEDLKSLDDKSLNELKDKLREKYNEEDKLERRAFERHGYFTANPESAKYDDRLRAVENEIKKRAESKNEPEKNKKSETEKEEDEETYTRVKFDDVPNSGKINLKKYLSEKVRKGVDEKWSNIKNIPTENLKKMEKGLVNDLNKNFEAIKKSQRAELLYSIMKVKGELESRGKETQKKE